MGLPCSWTAARRRRRTWARGEGEPALELAARSSLLLHCPTTRQHPRHLAASRLAGVPTIAACILLTTYPPYYMAPLCTHPPNQPTPIAVRIRSPYLCALSPTSPVHSWNLEPSASGSRLTAMYLPHTSHPRLWGSRRPSASCQLQRARQCILCSPNGNAPPL